MKTSTLKASKQSAETLWSDLELINNKIGKELYKRKNTDFGFTISGPKIDEDKKYVRNADGKIKRTTVFFYEKTEIGERITWDENTITI